MGTSSWTCTVMEAVPVAPQGSVVVTPMVCVPVDSDDGSASLGAVCDGCAACKRCTAR